ncbi:hypothetical protein P0082_09400 [Candidatus Haliotispira prima]|uniref:Uncharacterized protein n=1 Tax=Candidatus Haliotispira prima TaxID=3034016 RepID=A0ABY8MFD0_9SPIO|nr:hypothetical protein P0082_09400 [Candidatus Haliotispira prima]
MVLSGCEPLSGTGDPPATPGTGDPPATPSPTKSITVNYSGPHYVHFTVDYANLFADNTVGFLITGTDSSPSKAEAEVKKGYITRKFTEAKKSRDIFMFLHEGTAYEFSAGSTNIPFVASATASDTSFETSDILQENTSYKIRVYDGDTILEKTFTTKSFSAGDVSSEGLIAYMGGLVGAAKADVTLTIERKPEEIMLIPYADDAFVAEAISYIDNTVQASCSPSCSSNILGAYIYAIKAIQSGTNTILSLQAGKLVSLVYILSPQVRITPGTWTARKGASFVVSYNIEIISE